VKTRDCPVNVLSTDCAPTINFSLHLLALSLPVLLGICQICGRPLAIHCGNATAGSQS